MKEYKKKNQTKNQTIKLRPSRSRQLIHRGDEKLIVYRKKIFLLSIPILLNYLVTAGFEFVDKAMLGHYSSESFAAVGIMARMIYVFTGSFGIFASAFNIVAAKEIGREEENGFEQSFRIAIRIAHLVGIGFLVISVLFGRFFCESLYGMQGRVLEEALAYFYPASLTLWLNLLLFLCSVYFRNLENTKLTLYSTVTATVVNLFFDYAFVYGRFGLPELGGQGAAWGSVIGLLMGLFIYWIAYRKRLKQFRSGIQSQNLNGKREKNRIYLINQSKEMLRLYLPLLLQDLIEGSAFTVMLNGIIARLSVEQIGAYQLLETLGSALLLPVYAYSSAGITLALQKKEMGMSQEVKKLIKASVQLAVLTIILLGVVSSFISKPLMQLMVSDGQMIQIASKVIPLLICLQLMRALYEIYKGFLQGNGNETYVLTRTILIFLSSIVSLILLTNWFGLVGVYGGLFFTYLCFVFLYQRKIKEIG